MKVVHLGFNHKYNDIRIFEKECVSLTKYGYEVIYITSSSNSPAFGKIKYKGVKIIVIPVSSSDNFYVRILKFLIKVKKEALRQKADVYHIHEVWFLPIISALLRKGKVIYDSHEDAPRDHFERCRGRRITRVMIAEKLFEMYENWKVSQVTGVITATAHISKRFRKINRNTVTIANYPITDNYIELGNRGERKPLLCYAGGISKERGIEQLIRAMSHINAHLLIAGEVSKEYKDRLQQIEGADKCTFLGYLDQKNIIKLYQKCLIGCCTLLNVPNAYYSWPIKIFEYMASGMPVIASDFPEWKKIIEKHRCGLCVNPEDSMQIAEAVNKLLWNVKMAEEMGNNGRKMIEKRYNWRSEEKKLNTFYQEL